jgi:hypothetical protein
MARTTLGTPPYFLALPFLLWAGASTSAADVNPILSELRQKTSFWPRSTQSGGGETMRRKWDKKRCDSFVVLTTRSAAENDQTEESVYKKCLAHGVFVCSSIKFRRVPRHLAPHFVLALDVGAAL